MKLVLLLATILVLAGTAPYVVARKAEAPATALPSTKLRRWIDNTLPKINNLAGQNQVGNRTALVMAQADFAASAKVAPAAEQPMYHSAVAVMDTLIGAVDEHDKAVANFRYSKTVHGPQDTKDEEISNTHRGVGSGRTAEANNAKQNKENADSRRELIEKEKFLSKGSIDTWTTRAGQLRAAVEEAYGTELVAEKQVIAARTQKVEPPKTKPVPKRTVASAAEEYSPVGTWTGGRGGTYVLKEDNTWTFDQAGGTWAWTNQSKGELELTGRSGKVFKGVFAKGGRTLEITRPNGVTGTFTR
jgi:hypothetical protein